MTTNFSEFHKFYTIIYKNACLYLRDQPFIMKLEKSKTMKQVIVCQVDLPYLSLGGLSS